MFFQFCSRELTFVKRAPQPAAILSNLADHVSAFTAPSDRFEVRTPVRSKAMDKSSVWEDISTAPYDCDLELAVIDGNRVHPLVFACRRTTSGWVKASARERVLVSPTHWRLWPAKS
jgi:hypothetical protein